MKNEFDINVYLSYFLDYALAVILANPLELIRKYWQLALANYVLFSASSPVGVAKEIVGQHGVRGLYRGAHVFGFWMSACINFYALT